VEADIRPPLNDTLARQHSLKLISTEDLKIETIVKIRFFTQDVLKLYNASVEKVGAEFLVFNEFDSVIIKTLPTSLYSMESARALMSFDVLLMV
jgi:hypothetical protein